MSFLTIIIVFILNFLLFAKEYNIKDFGGRADTLAAQTEFIQKAIDKAFANGGGKVVIPSGTYKIGTIILKDNVNLYLEDGAVLIGSADINDYTQIHQKLESRTKDLYAKYFLLFAEDAKNISISGKGIIDGNGLKNFQVTRPQNERPYLIRFVNCENVTVRDVQLLESANWTLHLLACKDVVLDGLKIYNTTRANRDGLDIDACNNVMISNCRISSQDDAIVLKSTNDIICENVTITNCILSSHASALKTGTESNGGFKNISVTNCVIKDVPIHTGIELMTVDGGDLTNVTVSNIVMENVATPFFIYIGNRSRPYKAGQYVQKVSKVKDIYFNNITIKDAKLPSGVIGLNYRKIENVSFSNISVRYTKTTEKEPMAVNDFPLKDFSYPMAKMFGTNLPAYAFNCRNIDGLTFENIKVYAADNEQRPALLMDRVNNLEINNLLSVNNEKHKMMIYFRNSENIYAFLCRDTGQSDFLFTEEFNCKNVHILNNFPDSKQKMINKINALKDKQVFADFKSDFKYSIKNGEQIDGLTAKDISASPLKINIDLPDKGTPQICLLVKSESKEAQKIKLSYGKIEQVFEVDWDNWGWAPITLSAPHIDNKKIVFKIEAADPLKKLFIAKVYLKSLKLGYTD